MTLFDRFGMLLAPALRWVLAIQGRAINHILTGMARRSSPPRQGSSRPRSGPTGLTAIGEANLRTLLGASNCVTCTVCQRIMPKDQLGGRLTLQLAVWHVGQTVTIEACPGECAQLLFERVAAINFVEAPTATTTVSTQILAGHDRPFPFAALPAEDD
jgi:hypothetical protein